MRVEKKRPNLTIASILSIIYSFILFQTIFNFLFLRIVFGNGDEMGSRMFKTQLKNIFYISMTDYEKRRYISQDLYSVAVMEFIQFIHEYSHFRANISQSRIMIKRPDPPLLFVNFINHFFIFILCVSFHVYKIYLLKCESCKIQNKFCFITQYIICILFNLQSYKVLHFFLCFQYKKQLFIKYICFYLYDNEYFFYDVIPVS